MRIAGKRIWFGGKNLLPVFCAGLVAGIFIMNMGKSILLEDTGLFDEYTLYRMKYMTVDSGALFVMSFGKGCCCSWGWLYWLPPIWAMWSV